MGEMGILDRVRNAIGEIGFCLHLWALRMTDEQYIAQLFDHTLRRYVLRRCDLQIIMVGPMARLWIRDRIAEIEAQ